MQSILSTRSRGILKTLGIVGLTSAALLLASAGDADARKRRRKKAKPEPPKVELPERPSVGDVDNGSRIYGMYCASCHGYDGYGRGPATPGLDKPAANLRSAAAMLGQDEAALRRKIAEGSAASGGSRMMPAYGRILGALEMHDLVAYLKTLPPQIEGYFPEATRYIVKDYALASYGLKRIEKAFGRALSDAEKTITVLTVFRGGEGADSNAPPKFIPQLPTKLAELKKKDKLGYLAVAPMTLPGGGEMELTVVFDTDMKIKAMLDGRVDAGKKRPAKKSLTAFIGEGRRGGYDFFKPRGVDKKLRRSASEAILRLAEGVYTYEVEEKDRSWADDDF